MEEETSVLVRKKFQTLKCQATVYQEATNLLPPLELPPEGWPPSPTTPPQPEQYFIRKPYTGKIKKMAAIAA